MSMMTLGVHYVQGCRALTTGTGKEPEFEFPQHELSQNRVQVWAGRVRGNFGGLLMMTMMVSGWPEA